MTNRWLLWLVLGSITGGTAGCAALLGPRPAPEPRLLAWHGPVAIVSFVDLTGQSLGERVTAGFWQAARPQLAFALPMVILRPDSRMAGSWWRERAIASKAGAFLTGTISGYRIQPRQHRLWLSLTVRLVATDGSRVLWSKRLVAIEPVSAPTLADEAFARAVHTIAREFVHAFPTPS